MLQECFNQSQLPSPDQGLVCVATILKFVLLFKNMLCKTINIVFDCDLSVIQH